MPIPLGILAVAGAGAGGASSFDLLETTVLGSDTASVTFSNLGTYSAYKHLQLRMTLRRSGTGTDLVDLRVRFNGVSTLTHAYHEMTGNGTSVTSSGVGSEAGMEFYNCVASGANNSSIFGAAILDILDFNLTTKAKTVRGLYGGNAGNESRITLGSGLFTGTGAITSIALDPKANNFVTGSRFSLYGIKG